MKIVVCCKLTPDPGDIEVRSDGSISLERAEWGIGNFDLQAIEAGARLAKASGGKVTALSAGPRQIQNSKLKKDVLSRGPDELVLVVDESLRTADTSMTARVLSRAVQKIGQVDLVLCGEGSADLYFQQVGLQVGEMLSLPTLNAVSKIELSNPAGTEAQTVVVERSLEDELEILEVPLPAVISVTTDINQPRLPTMGEILKASKKPITEWTLADLGLDGQMASPVEVLEVRAPAQVQRKNVIIPGTADEAAQALIGYLSKEGIL
jgi:electron transfer flavoprotein beta subunit